MKEEIKYNFIPIKSLTKEIAKSKSADMKRGTRKEPHGPVVRHQGSLGDSADVKVERELSPRWKTAS